jgi:hypothetical protein
MLLFSLLGFAAIAAAQNATAPQNTTVPAYLKWPKEDFLSCEPANLTIDDVKSHSTPIKCKLNEEPDGDVDVSITGDGLKFTQCGMKFTPENWDEYQEIGVIPLPEFTTRKMDNQSIYLAASAPKDEALNKKVKPIAYTRNARKPATCTVSGDPHFISFLGQHYTYLGDGEFYLVDSDYGLRILGSYHKVQTVSLMQGLSVEYGDSSLIVSTTKGNDSFLQLDVRSLGDGPLIGMNYTIKGVRFS